jgi:hypothetical protein
MFLIFYVIIFVSIFVTFVCYHFCQEVLQSFPPDLISENVTRVKKYYTIKN